MIMVLCLLVYSFTEWVIRVTLRIEKKHIRDQKGKPTQKPSAKWLFFMFRRVRKIKEIVDSRILVRLLNFTKELREIVRWLGPHVVNIMRKLFGAEYREYHYWIAILLPSSDRTISPYYF
jgi:hypothetical protein